MTSVYEVLTNDFKQHSTPNAFSWHDMQIEAFYRNYLSRVMMHKDDAFGCYI